MPTPHPDGVQPERLRARLTELVRIPSLTGRESEAIARVASWLAALEPDELRHFTASMRELEQDPDYPGREVEREEVPVVAARIRGRRGPGPTLLLNGHVDVVPIGERAQWTHDPFGAEVVDGDRLYGRGACDMKSGLLAALEAFELFANARDAFCGELWFVAVPGEEDGGTGTLAAIRAGIRADFAIVCEPSSRTGGEPQLVIAHGGALTYTIEVEGRSAHAAKRLEGESAFEHFLPLHRAMVADEARINDAETEPVMRALGLPYPTSIGRVQGGQWSSSVIDRLIAEVRVGVSIHERCRDADARFRRALDEAAKGDPWLREHPPRVVRTGAAFESARLEPDHPLVASLSAAAAAEYGHAPELGGAPYGCDMALWLRVAGIPTVVYGPGDIRLAHAPDEWVSLTETARVARVLVHAALALTGTQESSA